jgi:hypothetical protein
VGLGSGQGGVVADHLQKFDWSVWLPMGKMANTGCIFWFLGAKKKKKKKKNGFLGYYILSYYIPGNTYSLHFFNEYLFLILRE